MSLPPGAGKTRLGVEFAAGLGRPAVAFAPNTAIAGQWARTWYQVTGQEASGSRDLDATFTSLTYQSLATFDPEARATAPDSGELVDLLHENGLALVQELRDAGPLTVILDECHHLLEVWGELLAEVLADLPEAVVVGLTATPPTALDRRQAALVGELFGPIVYTASIPAAVREGELAPFAELAWLTRPTDEEDAWLRSAADRFVALTREILATDYGSVPILTWFDSRFGTDPMPWVEVEQREPELARAALRLVHAGLLALPAGAVLREQHRADLDASDWAALIDDWVTSCLAVSGDPRDSAVIEDLRQAMPGIGYRVTRRGVSSMNSAVDRVLSRSASKMDAAAEIVAAERAVLGDRLRAVVICDHERASPTSSYALREAPAEHGSALQVMAALTGSRCPTLLVTGRTVAADPELAAELRTFAAANGVGGLQLRDLDGTDGLLSEIVGSWGSRSWVPVATAFLTAGHCQVLVGTRALLGEGWDAQQLTTLIDLSTATTTAAVIQTRGRALRLDPGWPQKVALTWSVVCVADGHPGGDSDWNRFVRKHQGYFGVDDQGEVVSGVAHVDARFSAYAPPVDDYAVINADMSERVGERAQIAARWRVGEPYDDRLHTAVRIIERRPAVTGPLGSLLTLTGSTRLQPQAPWARPGPAGATVDGRRGAVRRHPWKASRSAAEDPGLAAHGFLVADAMAYAGLGGTGAASVDALIDASGTYRLVLTGVDEDTSARFASLVEELLAPIGDPKYLVARYLGAAPTWRTGWRTLLGNDDAVAHSWYPVPAFLGANRALRAAFADAWARWMGPSELVSAGSPQGQAALLSCAGQAALDVHTLVRQAWS